MLDYFTIGVIVALAFWAAEGKNPRVDNIDRALDIALWPILVWHWIAVGKKRG